MKCALGTIIKHQQIAQDTYEMCIQASITDAMEPGQFVNIKVEGYSLRRPISISAIAQDHFTIVYKVVGDGTKKLSTMKQGDTLDLFGPLGHGYPIETNEDAVLLIGGGIGVPPMMELAKRYCALGKHVDVVLGFNDRPSIFYQEAFASLGAHVYIATMDGSTGIKGTVLDAIQAHNITTDFICACGPLPMLKALEQRYTKGYFSLEARMACGMGACMACVAKDAKEAEMYHRICKEGPVFPIGKVVLA